MAYRGLPRRLALAALVFAGTLAGHAQFVVSKTNSVGAVLDGSSATRDFTFGWGDLPGLGKITDVSLTLDFAKGDAGSPVSPAYADEIGFSLSNGLVSMDVVLPGQWQPDDGYFSGVMKFTDSAATPSWLLSGPTAGEFQAWSFFDVFFDIQLDPSVWTLTMTDTLAGAPLTFRSATLSITAASVPEPSTWTLAGAGALVALAAVRRHLRSRAARG